MSAPFLLRIPISVIVTFALALCLGASSVEAATAGEITASSRSALRQIYLTNPNVRELGRHAQAVLVYPTIVKGGLFEGGEKGDGAVLDRHGAVTYCHTSAHSYGPQATEPAFGYAIFFVNRKDLAHLDAPGGWEPAKTPGVVVLDKAAAHSLDTAPAKRGIYAMFFNQRSLIGGLGLQGAKITRIHPR